MPSTLNSDDLKSAVEAGVIDAAQAEKLKAMRASGAAAPGEESAVGDEERFRFLNGFNDVFLTIGVLLVTGALLTASTPSFSGSRWLSVTVFAAVVFWLLSEALVRRLRAVLPGIVLSILFVTFAATAAVIEFHSRYTLASDADIYSELAFWRNPTLLFSLPALIAAIAYYLRFRLPFALGLIAFFGYCTLSRSLAPYVGEASSLVALGFGLAVFAVALAYDARDLTRTTRLSDCAFWLHLVAAPLIVSPVITLIGHTADGDGAASVIVLLTVLALALVALAIDRRAILVASLTYFTVAVYNLLSGGILNHPGASTSTTLVATLALAGAFVLVLGAFWHPLRRRLMPLLQNAAFARYLPPAGQ